MNPKIMLPNISTLQRLLSSIIKIEIKNHTNINTNMKLTSDNFITYDLIFSHEYYLKLYKFNKSLWVLFVLFFCFNLLT